MRKNRGRSGIWETCGCWVDWIGRNEREMELGRTECGDGAGSRTVGRRRIGLLALGWSCSRTAIWQTSGCANLRKAEDRGMLESQDAGWMLRDSSTRADGLHTAQMLGLTQKIEAAMKWTAELDLLLVCNWG